MKRRALFFVGFILVAILSAGCSPGSSDLLGRYDAGGTSLYSAIEILPGNVAKIYSPVLPSAYTTTYERKGDYIFIKSDRGDLGYHIVDSNTLDGPGGGLMGAGNIEYKKSVSTSSDSQKPIEDVVNAFVSAIAEGRMDSALKVCAVDEYVHGFNFEADTLRLGLLMKRPPPASSDLYIQVDHFDRLAELARQIKFFCYSFSANTNEDVKALLNTGNVTVDDSKRVKAFVKDTDSANLRALKVREITILRPRPDSQLKSTWETQAKVYGCQEILDGAALLDLNGVTYGASFEFARYDSIWKILYLYSGILGANALGATFPISAADFNRLKEPIKELVLP